MPNFINPYNAYPTQMNVGPTQMNVGTQIQNGGFVSVRSEQEAMNYPIAPGTSITFKNEVEPYVYTKTMGFSQLDRPVFDKYRLVKEDPDATHSGPHRETFDMQVVNDRVESIQTEIKAIWDEIEGIKKKPGPKRGAKADDE